MGKRIYELIVKNEFGSKNHSISSSHRSIPLSSYHENEGFHAGELIGHAWAVCLHETLKVLLKVKRLTHESVCYVKVSYFEEEKPKIGYHFKLDAYVKIEGLSVDQTNIFLNKAHQLCPISKLIHQNDHVNVHIVTNHEEWMNM